MTDRLHVQASGITAEVGDPVGIAFLLGVHVTEESGKPVIGLTKGDFHVFALSQGGSELRVPLSIDFSNHSGARLAGVYEVETQTLLSVQAPAPQQFLLAVSVTRPGYQDPVMVNPVPAATGATTLAISYLGRMHS